MHLKHLLDAFHMGARLGKVALEALLELRIGGLLDHVGQGFHDLVFGVVDVLQRVNEQIVHRLDVCGEQAHGVIPFSGEGFRLGQRNPLGAEGHRHAASTMQ